MTEFEQSVERYLLLNSTFFPQEKVSQIKDKLLSNESAFNRARLMTLKDPNTLLLISVFVGQLGVDRFLINKKATGALKLIFWLIAYVCMFISFFVILNDDTYRMFFAFIIFGISNSMGYRSM